MQNSEKFASAQTQSNDLNAKDGKGGIARQTFVKNVRQQNSTNFVASHSPRRAHKPRTGKRMREFDNADNNSNNNNNTNNNNDSIQNSNINDHMHENNAQV